ncbi:Uncharacterised protein [Vibrio cholerae]|nr:Uncharacterised protein [Vibrio cholerae]
MKYGGAVLDDQVARNIHPTAASGRAMTFQERFDRSIQSCQRA